MSSRILVRAARASDSACCRVVTFFSDLAPDAKLSVTPTRTTSMIDIVTSNSMSVIPASPATNVCARRRR